MRWTDRLTGRQKEGQRGRCLDGERKIERLTGRLEGIKTDISNNKYSIQLGDKVIVNLLPQRLQSIGQENLKDRNVFQTD
jgi:hypothetical protein